MTSPANSMPGDMPAADPLAQVVAARTVWLTTVIRALASRPWVVGVWLVGSIGRGQADAFSDIDLVVAVDATMPADVLADPVAGLGLPGVVLYRRPKPRNAPRDGGYLAVGIEMAQLPVLVDVFVWPATTAVVSRAAKVVYERDRLPRSELGFVELLDAIRGTDVRGSDPRAPGTVLMLTQLAVKYLARGDHERLTGICGQLGIPATSHTADALHAVVDERIDLTAYPEVTAAVAAVHRLLDLAEEYVKAQNLATGPGANRSVAATRDGRDQEK